jgi:hypothetical protein
MLVFDNYSARQPRSEKSFVSRVVEFNPMTQEIFWEYAGSTGAPFHSSLMGAVHRLANGNTLIIESDFGRVFEVTPAKDIVWEYNNPYLSGPNNEYVAIIPDLIRLDPEFPLNNFVDPG